MTSERNNLPRPPRKSEDAPPDSTYPYGPCSRCGRQSNFTIVGRGPLTYDGGLIEERGGGHTKTWDEQVSILQCQGCGENMVVVEDQYIGGRRVRDHLGSGGGAIQWLGTFWWPPPDAGQLTDVPATVAETIAEASRCLLVRSPRAAAVMFRGALAQIVNDLGSEAAQRQRDLAQQLRQMTVDGDLTSSLADWADSVRLLGNAGAHPNELKPVTQPEAEELSRLTKSIVEYLYVVPARVKRARGGRVQ